MAFKATDQATKSFLDFCSRVPRIIGGIRHETSGPPPVPLVIRIGAAGHLNIEFEASLQVALQEIFEALGTYAFETNIAFQECVFGRKEHLPEPRIRLVSQLAPGLDQLAARCAMLVNERRTSTILGKCAAFEIDVVLPGKRAAFEQDMLGARQRTSANSLQTSQTNFNPDPVQEFRELVKRSRRVLELDRVSDGSRDLSFKSADYEQAASVILANSDILLVAIHDDATDGAGGTKWIESQGERLNLPIIRIPVNSPSDSNLIWTEGGRREKRRLFGDASPGVLPGVFESALTKELIGSNVSIDTIKMGWFERGLAVQLDAKVNEKFWEERWKTEYRTSLADHSLGQARLQVDEDLKQAKVWADHRASALAELVRGSFIVCMLFGVLAVACALLGLIYPDYGKAGKLVELACLCSILWFIYRSRRFLWRSQWLSSRELERCLDQAAWLSLLGRTRAYSSPAHLRHLNLDAVAIWCTCYLRAVLRNAAFPSARFDEDYTTTAHRLVLDNLIVGQIGYYKDEAEFNHRSDRRLEIWGWCCVGLAAVATALYLVVYVLLPKIAICPSLGPEFCQKLFDEDVRHVASLVASAVGVLMPAIAAAISAIRHHGEYAQIAGRFHSTAAALAESERDLERSLPDLRRGKPTPSSASTAHVVLRTTDALLQEVQGWNAILRKKEIELS